MVFPSFISFNKEVIQKNFNNHKVLVIAGKNSIKIIERDISNFDFFIIENKENPNVILDLINFIKEKKYSLLFSCGGGSIIDIGKYVSYKVKIPHVVVPTLLSNDAISSNICILRINGNYTKYKTKQPDGIIIDLDIIKKSPKEYLFSGIGELVSNLSAVYDWKLSHIKTREKINPVSCLFSTFIIKYILAKESYSIYEKEFLYYLALGLILSGISINLAGSSRPGSGSEHNISHALDELLGKDRKPHGIQVGFSSILTLALQGQFKLLDKVLSFYRKIGFPTNFKELNLDENIFYKALKIAPNIRDRYTILNEVEYDKVLNLSEFLLN